MPKLTPKNRISRKTFNQIVKLLRSTKLSHLDIAQQAGCTGAATVKMIAEGVHYYQTGKLRAVKGPRLPKKPRLAGRRTPGNVGRKEVYLPTPEEITKICAEIWETREEYRPRQPTVYSESDLTIV